MQRLAMADSWLRSLMRLWELLRGSNLEVSDGFLVEILFRVERLTCDNR
jgi:hypothetical protein